MSTKGTSKTKDKLKIPGSSISIEDNDLLGLGTGYVNFEQLVGTLIWAATQSNLRLFDASNLLETATLERRFSTCCVPANWKEPVDLWTEVRFYWPAEYTALSLLGDEALCDLYHPETVTCRHRRSPAEIFTELEVEYQLPYDFVQQLDSDEGVEKTARRVQQVFADMVEHDNLIGVEARAIYTGEELRLASIKAGHIWVLEEELRDLATLQEALLDICREVHTVLERFAKEFFVRREATHG